MAPPLRFKLVFFVPRTDTTRILSQLFARYPQQLGKIGDYEQCAFVSPGTGQFSLPPTDPLQKVEEDRVEIVVNDEGGKKELTNAIETLKEVHPYNEVAYDVYRLESI